MKKLTVKLIGIFIFVALLGGSALQAASPRVRIVSPHDDGVWVGTKEIRVELRNIKPDQIKSVEVYLDGKLVKEFTKTPYRFKYNFGSNPKNRKLEALARTMDRKKLRHVIRSYHTDDAHMVEVMQVPVPVVVTDTSGNYVNGLKKEDFILLEDGVQQDISYFSTSGKSTFHLALLIDISSSMKDKISEVKEVAKIFLKELLQKDDKAIVVFFNHEVFEDSDFTSDVDELSKSLSVAFPFGATALYDAVAYCVKLLKVNMGQNIIILFSDGEDNSSAIDPYTLMKIVERSNSVIYSIGREMDSYNQYHQLLKKIANSSGGITYFFNDVSDIDKLYRRIRRDIRAKYLLQFSPKIDKKLNRMRKIKVKLTDEAQRRIGRKCRVRTQKGYYY